MATSTDLPLSACRDNYAANQRTCSGFLPAVANAMKKPMGGTSADEQTAYIGRIGSAFRSLSRSSGRSKAHRSSRARRDRNTCRPSTTVTWRSWSRARSFKANTRCAGADACAGHHYSNGNQSVGQVWGVKSRDKVTYFCAL